MPDIYIISDYGRLYKKNDAFQFDYPDGTTSKFFPHNTQKIFIIGKIEISADAFRMLARHNIDVLFMNKNGRFNGKLVFKDGKNVLLRQKQYLKLDDEKFKISFCKNIVDGKIKNQLTFIHRIKRERKNIADVQGAADSVKGIIEKLNTSVSLDQLRGYEGAASRMYFSVFRLDIIPEWAVFGGRSMNPPLDNVNAVMSFIYTLMNQSIETQIMAEGLDTYVGYLHTLEYGRKSLVYDLMEEYRAPVCDTLTASLFNLGVLKEDDFRSQDFSKDDDEYPIDTGDSDAKKVSIKKGVLLTKEGLKKVIQHYEKKLEAQYHYPPAQTRISFRRLISEQVKHFRRVINGEEREYMPFVTK